MDTACPEGSSPMEKERRQDGWVHGVHRKGLWQWDVHVHASFTTWGQSEVKNKEWDKENKEKTWKKVENSLSTW